jgi:predicted lipoprotein
MRAKLGIALLIACALPAHARTIGEKAVENHIRPVYQRLANATAGLVTATDKFCDGGQKDRAGLSAAFKVAVLAWAGAEHLRFGPIAEQNRYERFAFWPDPKGLGPKQIAAALRDKDASVTTAEGLAQKSVALQGLTAFEILFWGGDAEKPAANAEAAALRCAYAKAIARNLAQISADVRDAWAPADGFAANLTAPGEGKVYHDDKDVTLELFKAFRTSLQQTRSAKLNRVLMGNIEEAQPRRAAFWRSGNAVAVIIENIAAAKEVYEKCGLSEIVHNAGQGEDKSTLDQFHLIEEAMDAVKGKSIADVTASQKSWARLNSIVFGLINIQTTGGNAIAEAAELPMSFNSLDGD